MSRRSYFRFAAPLAVLALGAALLPAEPPKEKDNTPAWAAALLKEVKLTPEQAQLDPKRPTGGAPHRLDTFNILWDDWRAIDPAARAAATNFLAASDSFEKLVATAAPFVDVEPPLAKPPARKDEAADAALARTISALHDATGKPLTNEQKADLGKRAKAVPEAVARAAGEVLDAVPRALKLREKALAKFDADKLPAAYQSALSLARNYKVDADTLKMIQDVDLAALVEGGQLLAGAIDRAEKLLAKPPAGKFSFAWETPIGTVALNGTADDSYGPGPYLLVIDTGGNDKYGSGGASTSASHPISVLIDLAGDDKYESKSGPAFGAGVLGYGFLLDAAGDDTYRADFAACGAASFGVGVLIDGGGKDKYEIDRTGQGGAFVGVGVLADLAGDDEYRCFLKAQGFGAVRGCGVLVDRAGDDKYIADDATIRNPSPQDPKHNTSLAQGCGFGLRDQLAGGVGLLIDAKGKDRYSCGVFGQGVSYWFALGMLIDLEGDDEYQGVWYCQGSAAHFAVGALVDLAGNDKYAAKLTMGQGAGHDYSTAWLHDAAGNDTYDCPGAGLGYALYNGVGIFRDGGGDDTYKSGGAGFGTTGETRPEHTCLALFIDEGGKNQFPKSGLAKPNSVWVQPAKKDQPRSYGVGVAK